MLIANKKNQELSKHCFAVGILSVKMFENLFNEKKYNNLLNELDLDENKIFKIENLKEIILNAGFYHDIGKTDINFQKYLNNVINSEITENNDTDIQIEPLNKKDTFTPEDYPLHQELSWALCSSSSAVKKLKSYHEEVFLYGIYWHHAKLLRTKKESFGNASLILESFNLNLKETFDNCKIFISEIKDLLNSYNIYNNLFIDFIEEDISEIRDNAYSKKTPQFQSSLFLSKNNDKEEFMKNALLHMVRTLIVSADRIVSTLEQNELNDVIENQDIESLLFKLKDDSFDLINIGIQNMLDSFNKKYGETERSIKQEIVTKELSRIDDVSVLYGPAGVGKTKMMLDWIFQKNNNKKTYIIVPKTSIAYSLYKEISAEYLPNNTIEIVTGDFKEKSCRGETITTDENNLFNSEINITTIDQILNMMLSHNKIDIFLDVLDSNLIYDEFHEFMDIPGVIMLFIQMILLKRFTTNSSCLLVSATPNLYLLKEKLFINTNKNLKQIESFNKTKYKIKIHEFEDNISASEIKNEMFNKINKGEIALFNSATKSQVSAINAIKQKEEKTLVYHSKLFNQDKKQIYSRIMKEFGKKLNTRDNSLRVGPILQASVDISTKHMHTEISTIDNIFQRLGRVVRWGESEQGYYSIYIPQDLSKNGSIKKGLESLANLNSTSKFIEFLLTKIKTKDEWTLNELYPLYMEFFQDKIVIKSYDEDWKKIKEMSKMVFDQGFEPVKMLNIKKIKSKDKIMSKKSLRGKSIYGIACTLNYNENNYEDIIEPEKDIKKSLFSIEKNSFYGIEARDKLLEENREQISKYFKSRPYLSEIENSIKNKSFAAKKKMKTMPIHWFLDFARNDSMPLILSFKDPLMKMSFGEQKFNVVYKNIKLGIMSYSLFNKVK